MTGLPAGQVWAITQDVEGYLWLGMNGGLVRFDGVRFSPFETFGDGRLPSTIVRALCASRDGSLWVGYGGSGGISRVRDGHATNYGGASGPIGVIRTIAEDSEGVIWAGGISGLFRFRDGRWEVMVGLGRRFPRVTDIFVDRSNNLWVSTAAGVFVKRSKDGSFELTVSSPRVEALGQDNEGRMLMGEPHQPIGAFQSSAVAVTQPIPTIVNPSDIVRDDAGDIWVATTGSGVWHLPQQPSAHVEQFSEKTGLTSDVVRAVFEDREGNVWAGTQEGLDRLSKGTISVLPIRGGIQPSKPISAVASATDGGIWIGTADGLYRLSDGALTRFGQGDGLPSDNILSLYNDARSGLWVATNQGISHLRGGYFQRLETDRQIRLGQVTTLVPDRHGTLWLYDTNEGLFRWRGGLLRSRDRIADGGRSALAATVDSQDRLWIGFLDGRVEVFDNDLRVQSYSTSDGLAGGVSSIYRGDDGTVWVGTTDNPGLSRFADGRFVTITSRDGLPGNIIGAILQSRIDRTLWLATNSSIVRLDPFEYYRAASDSSHPVAVTQFDFFDGLRGTPTTVSSAAAAQAKDGTLWFLTNSGLAAIDPRQAVKRRVKPHVRIEEVVADERRYAPATELLLPERSARVIINYTALTFTAAAKVRFRYRLEGFDADWVDAGVRRQAIYTNLPPRTYRFRVIADNDGVWNTTGAAVDFGIRPMFYQTNWFKAACAIAIVFAIGSAWQVRVRYARKRFALVLAERARMSREIHDTLLQSLAGVALQLDALGSEFGEKSQDRVRSKFEHLREQVEIYIREARNSIWDLRSPILRKRDLGRALGESCDAIASRYGLELVTAVEGTPGACDLRAEEQLLRIAQEAVSNAARHGRASVVRVTLRYSSSAVLLTISDNGCGFNPVAVLPGEHWGLAFMRERMQVVNGLFRLHSSPGAGTTVEAAVPLATPIPSTDG